MFTMPFDLRQVLGWIWIAVVAIWGAAFAADYINPNTANAVGLPSRCS